MAGQPPSAQEIAARRALADAGVERTQAAQSLAEQAARATTLDVALGHAKARVSSKAENGWAWCQYHGFLPAVDAEGRPARSGTCSACWKQLWSPEARALREAQTHDITERIEHQVVEQAVEEARLEAEALEGGTLGPDTSWVGDGDETSEPRPGDDAVDSRDPQVPAADVVHRVPLPVVAYGRPIPTVADTRAAVEGALGSGDSELDAWIRSMDTGA